ncbi:hypothetical protein IWW39_002427 [Coemansia spiralis]|uniref:Uncharacterized protein n=1 Tax=Coemansia spiralis TaxID=417178 RepID=A0A9W8GNE7_9FUNG|nr:hypothetical protein IWW39_002427 [Coemansia spiralis]
MGQSGSKLLASKGAKGGMRLPRTSQPPAAKTREQILGEEEAKDDDEEESKQLSANLKRFLNPQQHTTMTGMKPATTNTNVEALRQRQARDSLTRLESQQITKLLRDLGHGVTVEQAARDYKLDAKTVHTLHSFLTPVT